MSKKKFNNEICNNDMSFDECELTILRQAVDSTTEIQGKVATNSESIQKMILILENFLIRKKCICYGGTAINNILPKDVQFYDKSYEIPDYDFFSKTPIEDTKELTDLYFNAGFDDVEAKSGVHKGTYKVFVSFIPIADITYMVPEIYDNLEKESISILGIHYCPPNYLRMSIYLELSRPQGDVSRWEKVFKRLNLLNKYYPLKPDINCKKVNRKDKYNKIEPTIFSTIKDGFIKQGAVFFGGYATYLYSKYMPSNVKRLTDRIPEIDVLVEEYEECAIIVKERLEAIGIKEIQLIEHDAIEDIIPRHIELMIDKRSYAFIYEPIACHNYNVVTIDTQEINVATIDTMLSFYLAFTYLNNSHYNKDRILCLAKYLYEVEQHNRLKQYSILKRFSLKCIGKQQGLNEIRAEKANMYKKLSKERNTDEYNKWFFKYIPSQSTQTDKLVAKKKIKEYIEEDKAIIQRIKEDNTYGKYGNPSSIIQKYITPPGKKLKKGINNNRGKFKKGKHTYKKRRNLDDDEEDEDEEDEDEEDEEDEEEDEEDDEDQDEEEDQDEDEDSPKYKKNRKTQKWNKGKNRKNKTYKKSKFWKKFQEIKKSEEFNKDNQTSKSASKWFNWF